MAVLRGEQDGLPYLMEIYPWTGDNEPWIYWQAWPGDQYVRGQWILQVHIYSENTDEHNWMEDVHLPPWMKPSDVELVARAFLYKYGGYLKTEVDDAF